MPTNDELVARAQAAEVEGQETVDVANEVATQFGTISTELQTAKDEIARLTADQLPADARDTITAALDNAQALSDQGQAVLKALVAPPSDETPAGRRRRGK